MEKEIDKKNLSKMMTHYLNLKEKYKDVIIFYRLGDFYEMFFEDAKLCSKVLELTLTGRSCGLSEKAPMCGVPAKAVDIYLKRLLAQGYKVGICEQLTEPTGKANELVERDVVRIVTPGTVMEEEILEDKKNNFISCVFYNKDYYISFSDISTGEFYITKETTLKSLNDFLIMINPAEIICNSSMKNESELLSGVKQGAIVNFTKYEDENFNLRLAEDLFYKQFKTNNYKAYEITSNNEVICVGAMLSYLFKTQKRSLDYINKIKYYYSNEYMYLDVNTRKNLELTSSGRDNKRKGSILWLLDKTSTSMGGRMLRSFIEQPLYDEEKINERLDSVEEFFNKIIKRDELIELLKQVSDTERLSSKISYGSISPKDCLAIKNSLEIFPKIKELIKDFDTKLVKKVYNNIDDFTEIYNILNNALMSDTTVNNYKDGGYIKPNFDKELDEFNSLSNNSVEIINALQETERELTGIKNLKIDYNRVFGYYIEVTNGQKELVPYRYIRKQTLTNAERYYTEELKQIEDKIINSKEKALKREIEIFLLIKERLNQEITKLQNTSRLIALLDSLISLSVVATENNYVKPIINKNINHIKIHEGRHPVIEKLLSSGEFISNDTYLDNLDNRTMIITGPNMAGKSTYMRQVALITLLAHIGSFVPAKQAEISLTDRIFTRIGASDDLLFGQSTFMVEMSEVANILNNSTKNSLILLDEVGRGTATFDGLSIAYSLTEYITKNIKAKTLFSTHYHELTELEGKLEGVKNYRITVKEYDGNIIFLRKIVRGGANRSFGIEVARLAGLPIELINKSKEILSELESKNITQQESKVENTTNEKNINYLQIINMLKEIDINRISPIEALSILNNLKENI